jgi:hypothetical protein
VALGGVMLLPTAPAAFAAGGTGGIKGVVSSSPGTGVAGIEVEVLNAGSGGYVTSVFTVEHGEYMVRNLVAGVYKLRFFSPGGSSYAPQYYDEEPSLSEATPVVVAEGQTTTGIDGELHIGGKVQGVVTGAGAGGLEHVRVLGQSAAGGEEAFAEETETVVGGVYVLVGLPTGSYIVGFSPVSGYGLDFLPEYWDAAPSINEAAALSVEEGKTRSGIDAELQVGGEISGVVSDAATGAPLAGVQVAAQDAGGVFVGHAETNVNGEYAIVGLTGGAYRVVFEGESADGPGYISQYYDDQPSGVTATGVSVSVGGVVAGVDAALVREEPVNVAVPVVAGAAVVGNTVSCATGSWTGRSPLAYTYTWLRNGSAIPDATGDTYAVQAADQGTGLACEVTATNKYGSGSAVTSTLTATAPPVLAIVSPEPLVTFPDARLVASVSGGRVSVRVPVACASATCTGTIELTSRVVVKQRHGKKTTSKKETLILGRGAYSLAAGHTATIVIRLTASGKSTLADASHHELSARASASVTGGKTAARAVLLSEAVSRKWAS